MIMHKDINHLIFYRIIMVKNIKHCIYNNEYLKEYVYICHKLKDKKPSFEKAKSKA